MDHFLPAAGEARCELRLQSLVQ
jgi:hypothetical protein